MPEPADSWAPKQDDMVVCEGCHAEVNVADARYTGGGYVCFRCDE